jgi:hypothetical protein
MITEIKRKEEYGNIIYELGMFRFIEKYFKEQEIRKEALKI